MGNPAWSGWAMWEKLCFVLACAIVLTVSVGATKLAYTHWRLRKYIVLAEKEKREQATQRQLSQRRRHDEIPFGIRALESGVEVEGVWISRPNTPEKHSRESSGTSLGLHQLSTAPLGDDLEKRIPRVHVRGRSSMSSISGRALSAHADRSVSAERLPSSESTLESPLDAAYVKRPLRPHYPPCSYNKPSHNSSAHRQGSSDNVLEGLEAAQRASLEAIRRASTSLYHDDRSNSNKSSPSEKDDDPISAAAPQLFTAKPTPRIRDQSVDLEMMNSHRVSLAAETGQLAPRPRRPGRSADSNNLTLSTKFEQGDYFYRRKPLPPSPTGKSSLVQPLSTPKIDALPPAVRRSSMPDVTPFAQFCQTTPPSPAVDRPASQDGQRQERYHSGVSTVYFSAPSSPTTPTTPPPPLPVELPAEVPELPPAPTASSVRAQAPPVPPKRSSFEKRDPQILRGQGSGFEILAPGSLHPAMPGDDTPRSAPPISLHNGYRSRSRSSSAGHSGRRLQKKRGQSIDSAASAEAGRISPTNAGLR